MTLGSGSSISAGQVKATLKRGGLVLEETFVSSDGRLAFTQLTEGDYEVVIEAEGYRSYTHRAGLRYPGHEEENFSVRLLPIEDPGPDAVSPQELIPAEAVELFNQATRASQAGKREKAAEYYERAVALAPDYVQAWNNLGSEYRLLKHWAEAERALRRALELDPKSALACLNLGMLYLGQGKLEPAQEQLEQAVRKDPKQASAHFLLGLIAYQKQEMDLARREFRQSLQLDAQATPEARVYLGSILAWQGKFSEATRELEDFLRDHASHPQATTAEQLLKKIQSTTSAGTEP